MGTNDIKEVADHKKSCLTVGVRIQDMDIWTGVIDVLKEVVADERISADVRVEYMNKINDLVEGNGNDERELI